MRGLAHRKVEPLLGARGARVAGRQLVEQGREAESVTETIETAWLEGGAAVGQSYVDIHSLVSWSFGVPTQHRRVACAQRLVYALADDTSKVRSLPAPAVVWRASSDRIVHHDDGNRRAWFPPRASAAGVVALTAAA